MTVLIFFIYIVVTHVKKRVNFQSEVCHIISCVCIKSEVGEQIIQYTYRNVESFQTAYTLQHVLLGNR